MKRIIPMFLCLASVLAALAQGTTQIVVPNALANVEGNSGTSDPFTSSSFRLQMVFDASQFAIPAGASGRIDRISFRDDGASAGPVGFSFGGGSIQFSTTSRTPDSLSPTFADNIGSDATTVRNGAMPISGLFQSGANPQPFGSGITMTAPFWYNPQHGNLLLDITGAGGLTIFPGSLDAQSTVGDSVSRVFALNGNSLSGTADTLGLVTRFDMTVIPEPATWMLALFGSAILIFFRRR